MHLRKESARVVPLTTEAGKAAVRTDVAVMSGITVVRTVIRARDPRGTMAIVTAVVRMAAAETAVVRTAEIRTVSMQAAEQVQEMADLPTTNRTDLREVQDPASKVARVSALVAAAVKTAAVVLAVSAAIADRAADREIDSVISLQLRDLREKLLQRISKRSVRKTRDASVRKKISATARI